MIKYVDSVNEIKDNREKERKMNSDILHKINQLENDLKNKNLSNITFEKYNDNNKEKYKCKTARESVVSKSYQSYQNIEDNKTKKNGDEENNDSDDDNDIENNKDEGCFII